MHLTQFKFARGFTALAKVLMLVGAGVSLPAAANSDYDIPNESVVTSLQIKIGQYDSPGNLTYYTREEVIAQNRPLGGTAIDLQTFYKFKAPFRDAIFEINACETPFAEVNNNAPQFFSNVEFQIGRGDYPNVFWTTLPRPDGMEIAALFPEGCKFTLQQQYLRDYQAGFSTPGKTDSRLDHFQDLHVRAKFGLAGSFMPSNSNQLLFVTAYSPALNLNVPATGAISIYHESQPIDFYHTQYPFRIDSSGVTELDGAAPAGHSYAWLYGYFDEAGRKYYLDQQPAREIIDYDLINLPNHVFGAATVNMTVFANYRNYNYPPGARPYLEAIMYYADQASFERTAFRATIFHNNHRTFFRPLLYPPNGPSINPAVCADNPAQCYTHDQPAVFIVNLADREELRSVTIQIETVSSREAAAPYIVSQQLLTLAGSAATLSVTLEISDANFYDQGKDEARIKFEVYDQFGGRAGLTMTLRPYQQVRGAVQINYRPQVLPGEEFFGLHVGAAGEGILTPDLSNIRIEDLASYTLIRSRWYEGGQRIINATTQLFTLSAERAQRLRATGQALQYKATYMNRDGYQYGVQGDFRPAQLKITVSRPGFAHDGSAPAVPAATFSYDLVNAPVGASLEQLNVINNGDGERPSLVTTYLFPEATQQWEFSIDDFYLVYNAGGFRKFPGNSTWRTPPYYAAHAWLRQSDGTRVKIAAPRLYNQNLPLNNQVSLAIIAPTTGQAAAAAAGNYITVNAAALRDGNGEITLQSRWEVSPTADFTSWRFVRPAPGLFHNAVTLRFADINGQQRYLRNVIRTQDRFDGLATVTVGPIDLNQPVTGALSISIVNDLLTTDGYVTLITTEIADPNGGEFVAFNWYFIRLIDDPGFGIRTVQPSHRQISELDMALLNMGLQLNIEAVHRDSLGFLTTLHARADYNQMAQQGNAPTEGQITLQGPEHWAPTSAFTVDVSGLTDPNGIGTFSYQWYTQFAAGALQEIPGATMQIYSLAVADWTELPAGAAPAVHVSVLHTDQAFYEQSFQAQRRHVDLPTQLAPFAQVPEIAGATLSLTTPVTDPNGLAAATYEWRSFVAGTLHATLTTRTPEYVVAAADFNPADALQLAVATRDYFGGRQTLTTDFYQINYAPTGDLTIVIMGAVLRAGVAATVMTSAVQDRNGGGLISYSWGFDSQAGIQVLQTINGYTLTSQDLELFRAGQTLRINALYEDSLGFVTPFAAHVHRDILDNSNSPTEGQVVIDGPDSFYSGATFTANIAAVRDANGLGNFEFAWQASYDLGNTFNDLGVTGQIYTLDLAALPPLTNPLILQMSTELLDLVGYRFTLAATKQHQDTAPAALQITAPALQPGAPVSLSPPLTDLNGIRTATYRWQTGNADFSDFPKRAKPSEHLYY